MKLATIALAAFSCVVALATGFAQSANSPDPASNKDRPVNINLHVESTKPTTAHPTTDEGLVLQLWNNRDATSFASALEGFQGAHPKAIGKDLLLVPDATDNQSAKEIKRIVASADLARAQVDLHLLSVQVSSNNADTTAEAARRIESIVQSYNYEITDALERGWQVMAKLDPQDFDQQLHAHIADPFLSTSRKYSLGYEDVFGYGSPSLSKLIFLSAASHDPIGNVEKMLENIWGLSDKDQTKARLETYKSANLGVCEQTDKKLLKEEFPSEKKKNRNDARMFHPQFVCLYQQLRRSLDPSLRLPFMRIAIADFLYQYKMSVQYARSFEPYDLQRASAQLNTQLEPIMSALNRDLRVYLNLVEDEIAQVVKAQKATFTSTGVITIHSTSSTKAESTVETANSFESPSTPTINDLPAALSEGGKDVPGLIAGNFTARAAEALIGGLNLAKGRAVKLGRSLIVSVTPTEVSDGSAADLEISLQSFDSPANPSSMMDDKNSADDTNRVSKHTVDTTIRVPAMRMFEISTFAASLTRRKASIPLAPPLLEVPYIGNFFRLPLGTSKAFHRSVVIGAAIIVPTAADLAHSISFTTDEVSSLSAADKERIAEKSGRYHKSLMACWARSQMAECQRSVELATANGK